MSAPGRYRSPLVPGNIAHRVAEVTEATLNTRWWRVKVALPWHERGKRVLYDLDEVAAWRDGRTRRVMPGDQAEVG